MFSTLLYCLLSALFIYLALCTFYFLIVTFVNLIKKRQRYYSSARKQKIAVLIPAYKEDHVILETVAAAMNHNYPRHSYDVYVIADSMRHETLNSIRDLAAHVIEVHHTVSSKAQSLHVALNSIDPDVYPIAFILDADNIMSAGCLEKVNHAFTGGVHALQCHRVAKNYNTPIALLDSINEEINNSLFRSGQRALGFSSTSAGSGMAFNFKLLKEIFNLQKILEDTGEDKEIDLQLLRKKIRMEYIEDAYIYDEKSSDVASFKNQRLRWVEAHINHMFRFFDQDIRSLPKDIEFMNKLFQYLILPRTFFILLIVVISIMAISEEALDYPLLSPGKRWWALVIITYMITLVLSIPVRFFNRKTLLSLLHIPRIAQSMLQNMIRFRLHRKEFIHTPKKQFRILSLAAQVASSRWRSVHNAL